MFFSTVTSVLALAAYASAAAPAVTYPHQGTVWENTWYHNVTWTPQSGNGDIMLLHAGNMTPLKSNVDLSTGRVVIQVPQSVTQANDWVVQIMVGSDSSKSDQFLIGPPSAVAPSGSVISGSAASTSASGSGSATGTAAVSSASSALSSASSAAASATGASASGSAAASVSSDINSLSASAASALSSSLAAASESGVSSLNSILSSATASGASKVSSILSSATAPTGSGSSSGAASLGVSAFGAVVAAGLVAVTTLSGALVL